MPLDKYREANRANWDERVEGHWTSDCYDIEGFRSGKSPLYQVDIDALGDLTGKSLIHLQYHIGTDTLGLARIGANVTDIDLSGESIKAARRFSEESGVLADSTKPISMNHQTSFRSSSMSSSQATVQSADCLILMDGGV
jgi:2-polyprenyl-3-methyl-5-hydroxy-6-metoxy-1,4-benzoquinol methylase